MDQRSRDTVRATVRRKPLQAAKFVGVLLVLVVGVAGFFRLLDAGAVVDNPLLADGQFLALLFVPLVSLVLVVVVLGETVVAGYRILRSDAPVSEQATGRPGYVLLRCVEGAVAVAGVLLMLALLPTLFAENTPAPIGVGVMLGLMAVGLAILGASLVRSLAELLYYRGSRETA